MAYEYICTNDLHYDKKMFEVILRDCDNAQILYKNIEMSKPIKKLLFGNKMAKNLPRICSFISGLSRHELDVELKKREASDDIHIVFFNVSLKYYSINRLKKYRSRFKNIKMDLCFIDSEKQSSSTAGYLYLQSNPSLFDRVFTISKEDAEKWGIGISYSPYSIIPQLTKISEENCKYDIYWGGTLKGRDPIIRSLISKLKSNQIDYKIEAYTWSKKGTEIEGIGTTLGQEDFVDYDEMLERALKANVILDIVKGSVPITLRTYEAVVYNKKLLTNNPRILDFKYYDNKNIRYFENPEDIDYSWIKNREKPNYNYKGEFSPKTIFEL